MASKAIVLFALLFGTIGIIYILGFKEQFTPAYTNGVSLYFSFLSHLGIVIGPAALYGLRMNNYSVYPSMYAQALQSRANLLNLGRMQHSLANRVTSLPALALAPLTLMALGLQLCDSMNLLYAVPALLWLGVTVSAMAYRSRALLAPAWLARQYYLYAGAAFLTTSIIANKLLAQNMQTDETSKIMRNLQKELDAQKRLGGKHTSEEAEKMRMHKEMMKELKDPFL